MRTLATGHSSRAAKQRGFTLIEVLVVMLILGVLAGSIALTLPDTHLDNPQVAIERYVEQARWAQERSLWTGRPQAWEIGAGGTQIFTRQGETWAADAASEARLRPLPTGLRLKTIDLEGVAQQSGARIVFRLGEAPAFRAVFESADTQWQVSAPPGGIPLAQRRELKGGEWTVVR